MYHIDISIGQMMVLTLKLLFADLFILILFIDTDCGDNDTLLTLILRPEPTHIEA